jgi:hypothetical protein
MTLEQVVDCQTCAEGVPGPIINDHKEWRPQAEAIIGSCNAYRFFGEEYFPGAAYSTH